MSTETVEITGVTADVAGALEGLYRRHGTLRDADVVAEARRKSSALHNYFQWDDKAAAEAHRIQQAQQLIRRVKVKVITPENQVVQVRAYLANSDLAPDTTADLEPGTYRSLQDVSTERGQVDALMLSMRRDLLQLQSKYESSELFFRMVAEVFG